MSPPLADDLAALRRALADADAASSSGDPAARSAAAAALRAACAKVAGPDGGGGGGPPTAPPLPSARVAISAEDMSAEVVDSNPYSRLMALQRMGIVHEYKQIRRKAVAVVGVGGVGSVAAEMLARCGVGRLQLYDFDVVELANMNRLFFRPEHAGMTKTDAAARTLRDINPDVECESYHMNITTVEGFDAFARSLREGEDGERTSSGDEKRGRSRVDLVLSCVDNYEARMCINQACLELGQTWMESGVSEDAVSGHVQTMEPGATACFACVPPLVVASGIDEKTLKREGVCAASLPTTMGMVAGMLVQNALKKMLNFGEVTPYLGYSALKDFFPTMRVKCNPDCDNAKCVERQRLVAERLASPEYRAEVEAEAARRRAREEADAKAPTHEENEWGIEVADDAGDGGEGVEGASGGGESGEGGRAEASEGIEFSMPAARKIDDATLEAYKVADTGAGLDDLMSQLAGLSGDAAARER